MKAITAEALAALSTQAAGRARLRANWDIHASATDPVQRFCNAIEPGSYIRPHRHGEAGKWELSIALKGRVVLVLFTPEGVLTDRIVLSAGGPTFGIETAPGTWHSFAGLEPGSVLFELKPGPYDPAADKDFAAWAPPEGDPRCSLFEAWFRTGAMGSAPPTRQP